MELSDIDNANFTFITFRAHVSEPQVFEDFISTFLPYISLKFSFYIYSIEDDDTSSRHIHLLLQHDQKDKQKLKQKIEAKYFKDFSKSIQDKQTNLKCAIKYGKGPDGEDFGFTMKIEDKMKCIGYIFKDITRRNKISGLSQSLITTCCDFYFANRRIKNTTDNDWKQLTVKNIHVKIEEYCKATGQDVLSPLLQFNMVQDKHTFIQLTTKQRKMALAELAISQGHSDDKIRTEMEGEEYIQNEFYTPNEIMAIKNEAVAENKRLIQENLDLREQIKLLKNK
jgi:hypothetical protein